MINACLLDGSCAEFAAIFGSVAGAKGLRPTNIQSNKAVGDAARDDVLTAHPGARTEKSFQTSQGTRRIDVLTAQGIAIEVKVGRVAMSPTIYRQIMKDAELVANKANNINGAEWVFKVSPTTGKVGPSPSVALLLNEMKVPWRLDG